MRNSYTKYVERGERGAGVVFFISVSTVSPMGIDIAI
jgi:hypothetical protein